MWIFWWSFFPDQSPGLITLMGMRLELEEMVGRKVDLRIPREFHERNRVRILGEAETLYAREN